MVEAPDNKTISKISVEFDYRGTLPLMSMPTFEISVYVNHIVVQPKRH